MTQGYGLRKTRRQEHWEDRRNLAALAWHSAKPQVMKFPPPDTSHNNNELIRSLNGTVVRSEG